MCFAAALMATLGLHLNLKPFVSYDEMDKLLDQAKYIITHAGTGSILSGLKKGKKVIAAPRLKRIA